MLKENDSCDGDSQAPLVAPNLTPEQHNNLEMVIARGAAGSSHLDSKRHAGGMPDFRPSTAQPVKKGPRVRVMKWGFVK